MRYAICNINIEIPVPDNATDEEVEDIVMNYELPHEYVSESFEYIKTVKEDE